MPDPIRSEEQSANAPPTGKALRQCGVIAHRGASGYLPEHTLAAKAFAYASGADYLEQDLVLTRDDKIIVLHDIHLDTVSNVAELYPTRKREDGRYYAVDLDLAEIKKLDVHERVDLESGRAVFPKRFPLGKSTFRIPTLAEEIELVQGLNKSTGRSIGIYPEIKHPAWHRQQGKDISKIVLAELERYGYLDKNDAAFLQCFDAVETKRIRIELGCKLRIIQLIAGDQNKSTPPLTPEGLIEIKSYADGVGPSMNQLIHQLDNKGTPVVADWVQQAQNHGLNIHPYTFRADALPNYSESFEHLLEIFVGTARIDGLFTDFPDQAAKYLDNLGD